jgi:hypothetical protein
VNCLAASEPAHHQAWLAAGLRRASRGLGVDLSVSYSEAVAAHGLRCGDSIGVTRQGCGVVLHTLPEAGDRLPIVLGYADAHGQWYRDGSRHQAATAVLESSFAAARRGIEA